MEKFTAILSALLFFTSSWRLNDCCLSLTGSNLEFAEGSSRRQGVFEPSTNIIAPGLSFTCSGNVTSWQAYMETTRHSTFEVIIFQVWRPLSSCSFELMGSHRIENYRVGRDDLVDTSTVEALTPIAVESGDVVGVYVEDGTSSVQEYSDSSMTYIVEEAEGSDDVSMVDFCTGAVTSNAGAPIITAVVIEAPTVMATTPTASTAAVTTFDTTTTSAVTTPATTVTTPSTTVTTPTTTVTTPVTTVTTPTTTLGSTTGVSSTSPTNTSPMTTPTTIGGGSPTVNTSSGTAAATMTTSSATSETTTTASATSSTSSEKAETSTSNIMGNAGGLMTDKPPPGDQLSLYAAAASGCVAVLLATLLCVICVYCCVVRIKKSRKNLRCNRHLDHPSSKTSIELDKFDKTKSLDSRFETSNIYSTAENSLLDSDLSYGGSCLKNFNSLECSCDYEVPVTTMSREVHKKDVLSAYNKQSNVGSRVKSPAGNPVPRSKAHPQKRPSIPVPAVPAYDRLPPVAKKAYTLEVSGVYDVPIGAQKHTMRNACDDIYEEPDCAIQYTAQQAHGQGDSSPSIAGVHAAVVDDDEDYTAMDYNPNAPLDTANDSVYELV